MAAPTVQSLAAVNDRIRLKDYARLRNIGWSAYEALLQAGLPVDGQDMAATNHLAFERQDHVQAAIIADLESLTIAEMWNRKLALRALLETIRAPQTKDSARVAAIKVANEISGFGEAELQSRALYRTLQEFYDAQRGKKE